MTEKRLSSNDTRNKVELEDIIGIVKTDEITNSVELKKEVYNDAKNQFIEKRYFKKMWEEEFYIFDSNTISESDFEEKLEYQGYKAFEDSMTGDTVVNRLNELNEEKETYKSLWEEMAYYFQDDEKVNSLNDLDHKDFKALQRLSKGLVD